MYKNGDVFDEHLHSPRQQKEEENTSNMAPSWHGMNTETIGFMLTGTYGPSIGRL